MFNTEPTLFDTVPSAAKTLRSVSPNSVDAFYKKETQLKRGTQKFQIVECLKTYGVLSQREISEITRIPRHLVPDRVLRLVESGLIEIVGSRHDQTTDKDVNIYKVKGV